MCRKAVEFGPDLRAGLGQQGECAARAPPVREGRRRLLRGHQVRPEVRTSLGQQGERRSQSPAGTRRPSPTSEEAVQLDPKLATVALANRGDAYAGLASYEKALADCASRGEDGAPGASLHYSLGYVLSTIGRTEEAIAEYRDWRYNSTRTTLRPTAISASSSCNWADSPRRWPYLPPGHELGSRFPAGPTPRPGWCGSVDVRSSSRRSSPPSSKARRRRRPPPSASSWRGTVPQETACRRRPLYEEAFAAEPKLAEDLGPPTATTPRAPPRWPAAARARTPTSSTPGA